MLHVCYVLIPYQHQIFFFDYCRRKHGGNTEHTRSWVGDNEYLVLVISILCVEILNIWRVCIVDVLLYRIC